MHVSSSKAAPQRGPAWRLAGLAGEWPFAAGLILLAVVSIIFLLAPNLDIAASRLFYDSSTGFLHRRVGGLRAIRNAAAVIEVLLAGAAAMPLLVKLARPDRPILIAPRVSLFLLATYALGPGLLVNTVLKETWGRARPRSIVEFGGDATFSPAWWISDQCGRNCSFASGESASAFWVLALAFVVPHRWRPAVAGLGLLFATVVSLTRLAMGGHFLSDILVAWLVTLLVIILVHRFLVLRLPSRFDLAVERALAHAGRETRAAFSLRGPSPPL